MKIHFEADELAARRTATITNLEHEGLDGLLMFRQESMYYLTGYDTIGFVFFQCLYLGVDGSMFLLTRRPDLLQAQQTSIIDEIHIWRDHQDANPSRDLRDLLLSKGLSGKTLGVELESYGLTAANSKKLHASLDGVVTLVEASYLVTRQRVIKSAAELEYVRRAGDLSDAALAEAIRLTEPGVSEATILAAMQAAVLAGDGDYPACEFIIGSGPYAQLVRYHSGRRTLDPQDQLTLEYAGVFRHYHAVAMQTIVIGEADPEHYERHTACRDTLLACEEALRPGHTIGEVYAAGARLLGSAGYGEDRFHAFGYSLGACYGPNWMDWPMIYEDNPAIIQPGMVFFVHLILPNSETGLSQTLGRTSIVGENGAQPVCCRNLDLICK
jgi:Xaa-Pro dipeptidase